MKSRFAESLLALLPRLVVAGLLTYAAVPKILAAGDFIAAVGNYHLLPPAGNYAAGLFLPWLELVVGVALIGPRRVRDGAWLLACALFTTFFVAQLSALLRGLDISCGCFGDAGKVDAGGVALRFALVGFAMWGWRRDWLARNRAAAQPEANTGLRQT